MDKTKKAEDPAFFAVEKTRKIYEKLYTYSPSKKKFLYRPFFIHTYPRGTKLFSQLFPYRIHNVSDAQVFLVRFGYFFAGMEYRSVVLPVEGVTDMLQT